MVYSGLSCKEHLISPATYCAVDFVTAKAFKPLPEVRRETGHTHKHTTHNKNNNTQQEQHNTRHDKNNTTTTQHTTRQEQPEVREYTQ